MATFSRKGFWLTLTPALAAVLPAVSLGEVEIARTVTTGGWGEGTAQIKRGRKPLVSCRGVYQHLTLEALCAQTHQNKCWLWEMGHGFALSSRSFSEAHWENRTVSSSNSPHLSEVGGTGSFVSLKWFFITEISDLRDSPWTYRQNHIVKQVWRLHLNI